LGAQQPTKPQREYTGDRRKDRNGDMRRDRRQDHRADRIERRNGRHDYRGHRGYNQRRPGYRKYSGNWFPPAAFIAGAIERGAIVNGANEPP